MDVSLEKIRVAALDRAASSGNWEDIEKAASVAKLLAEAEKNRSDSHNARRQMHLQMITSLASFLIPIVSLLALFGTVYFQIQQQRETRDQAAFQQAMTREQNEDNQWRDLLITLRGAPDAFDSDVTAAPRLASFFPSARYGDQAKEISIRMMGKLTNRAGFKELFNTVFADLNAMSFARALDVSRALYATRVNIETECTNISVSYQVPDTEIAGLCTLSTSVSDLTKMIKAPFPQRALELRQAVGEVYAEMQFISEAIGPYIKANYAVGAVKQSEPLDLSNIDLLDVDLSNVEFENISLNNTWLWNVNLVGADLKPKNFSSVWIDSSNWWDASAIDQSLLIKLINNQLPVVLVSDGSIIPPTEEQFKSRVEKLCHPVAPFCAAQNVRMPSITTNSLGYQ